MILGSLNVFGAVGLIVNNKTYVPVRGVFEELGFNVTYDKENATAIIIDSNFTIKIPKDKTYFFVNKQFINWFSFVPNGKYVFTITSYS